MLSRAHRGTCMEAQEYYSASFMVCCHAIRSYDQIRALQSPEPVATSPPALDTATEMTALGGREYRRQRQSRPNRKCGSPGSENTARRFRKVTARGVQGQRKEGIGSAPWHQKARPDAQRTRILVTLEHELRLCRLRIPELNAAVFGTRDDPRAVGRDVDRQDVVLRHVEMPKSQYEGRQHVRNPGRPTL